MPHGVPNRSTLSDARIADLLEALDKLTAGPRPGQRPVHAKAILCSGIFTPTPQARTLTRAPHANQPSTPITVRFSNASGLPLSADNDPAQGSPRGMAVRWHLAPHVHTDIVTHSIDAFPTRTADEFLDFLHAALASTPDAPKPTPIEQFLASHPAALAFVTAPKPIPTSYAHESFFGVNAFKFTNAAGHSRFGRIRVRPHANNFYLSPEEAAAKDPNFLVTELTARLANQPVRHQIKIQLAEEGDDPNDATSHWPESRQELDFGTLTLTKVEDPTTPENQRTIFDPVPRVEGIDPSDDPLIEVRAAIYLLSGRRRRASAPT
jgi:catalase